MSNAQTLLLILSILIIFFFSHLKVSVFISFGTLFIQKVYIARKLILFA